MDTLGRVYHARTSNASSGIILRFEGRKRYILGYGPPAADSGDDSDELILIEFDVCDDSFPLPFNLTFGDSADTIVTKIGRKAKEKSAEQSYGSAWKFQFDDFRLMAALNKQLQLIWIRVFKMNLSEKSRIELQRQLRDQRKNIKPENTETVAAFKKKLPTQAWKKRLAEGDEILNSRNIEETETILVEFIDKLVEYTIARKASNIFNAVPKLTRIINKLNVKFDDFIDSYEREELCAFINEAVRATGFNLTDDVDLTEEYRDW